MADALELLKQLQAVDGELYRLRRAQQEKPKELERITSEVAGQEARVKAAEAEMKSLQLAQKEKEGELASREANVKKLQGQLFQVKTNKEYTAMQHEIDTLKADNSLLEEGILKLFDAIDQAASGKRREQARWTEAQERFRVEQQRLERELAVITEQITELERQRQVIAPAIPRESLETYERVLHIRDGLALVPLIEDSCGGCHRRLPPQVISEVYLNSRLVMCETCNRILYRNEAAGS